jgi:diguanylate cyclase
MLEGHDPYLVALSMGVAILGGYTGFGLAARIREASGVGRRTMLVGAAGFLAIGIWTMHFVGMLAAPLPADAVYLVLPTLVSFLICALVVGVSLFFVSVGEPTRLRVVASAVLLGVGIASMHYVGMHGLSGHFGLAHDPWIVALSVLIAIGAAYGGLQVFLARQGGWPLALSAVAFGVAVSGMHYTAMYGMRIVPISEGMHHHLEGMVASQQILSLVVALLCFIIAAGFLLSLMPDARRRPLAANGVNVDFPESYERGDLPQRRSANPVERTAATPLAGLGQPRPALASRIPVEGADGTHLLYSDDVRSFRADAHYTRVHDGVRERMCPWSISEAEAQLDPNRFLRVHRSHIVAIPHIAVVRKEGDGAVIELAGDAVPFVPVSRARIAEVKARLGLVRRSA